MTEGDCGYYESRQYTYPTTKDCDGVPIYPHTGSGTGPDPYVMEKVRHHRMPDTTLEQHFYGDQTITFGDMYPTLGAGNTSGNQPSVYSGVSAPRIVSCLLYTSPSPRDRG